MQRVHEQKPHLQQAPDMALCSVSPGLRLGQCLLQALLFLLYLIKLLLHLLHLLLQVLLAGACALLALHVGCSGSSLHVLLLLAKKMLSLLELRPECRCFCSSTVLLLLELLLHVGQLRRQLLHLLCRLLHLLQQRSLPASLLLQLLGLLCMLLLQICHLGR